MNRLPLQGVRLLDLTMAWSGPYGTRLLADMGAEVIKIESVSHWDRLRSFTSARGGSAFGGGQPASGERVWNKSPYFNHLNRNKYGLSLDLSHPRGRELFLRLVAISDAVIENFRSGVMDDLGLSLDVLQQARPDIILVSIPDLGNDGPERQFIAYGSTVEELSGYGDLMAGIAAAAAIALALWKRRRLPGVGGQRAEIAQGENLINVIGEYIVGYAMNQQEPARLGNRHPSMAPHGCYPCRGDDQWVAITCEDDDQFAALCAVIGRAGLAQDEHFADVVCRYRRQDELDEIIAAWTGGRTKEDVTKALQAAGVPAAPVLSVPELYDDPHLRARGFFETVAHPDAGVWDMDGCPWRLSPDWSGPAHVRLPAPRFGEHNDYVLRHLLGLSQGEMESLASRGVISAEGGSASGGGDRPNWAVHE